MRLILSNKSGAGTSYTVSNKAACLEAIARWSDPKNLLAHVMDEDITIWEGKASSLRRSMPASAMRSARKV